MYTTTKMTTASSRTPCISPAGHSGAGKSSARVSEPHGGDAEAPGAAAAAAARAALDEAVSTAVLLAAAVGLAQATTYVFGWE